MHIKSVLEKYRNNLAENLRIVQKKIIKIQKAEKYYVGSISFLLCTITGCDSPDYTASIKEPFSHTETMAPTDTSDDIVSTGEALSEEDVLVDVSSLSIPEYSGTDFYVVNDNVPFSMRK